MPQYGYRCPRCQWEAEIKISMAEYDKEKDKQRCELCSTILKRTISKPVVNFAGNGWVDQGYEITDMETSRNLDIENRMAGEASEMQYQDRKNNS